ncbi:flagellar hook-associated protein FlgL [Anaerovorax odorimutans]|uniref:flagellar hook-associated protein FlgL n=1 Tax=Anaerovorax odorimutans TaxID=109327 RepID=UPI00041CAC7C|nr:flagellar hook-associated protein FlgL [Anaerovorax odorimutans]
MRITSGIMMRQYNRRLNTIISDLNKANETITTRRKFTKASENPSESVKSQQLRREILQNENYQTNLRDVQSKFDSIESNMMNISKIGETAYVDILKVINGTNSIDERKIVAAELREMQESIIMNCNSQFNDQYIFGGSSTKEAPFAIDKTTGAVTFRGINVNTTDPTELATLKKMAEENTYIDLGFGMTFDSSDPNNPNTIKNNSAYNTAMPGISFLGYGHDSSGNSNNLVVHLGEIADMLESPTYSPENIEPLSKKLDVQRKDLLIGITKLGSNTKFLDYTEKRLEDNEYNINEKIENTEFVDLAEAISAFKMQDMTYRAALKTGMDILSVSFIDFMK